MHNRKGSRDVGRKPKEETQMANEHLERELSSINTQRNGEKE